MTLGAQVQRCHLQHLWLGRFVHAVTGGNATEGTARVVVGDADTLRVRDAKIVTAVATTGAEAGFNGAEQVIVVA